MNRVEHYEAAEHKLEAVETAQFALANGFGSGIPAGYIEHNLKAAHVHAMLANVSAGVAEDAGERAERKAAHSIERAAEIADEGGAPDGATDA